MLAPQFEIGGGSGSSHIHDPCVPTWQAPNAQTMAAFPATPVRTRCKARERREVPPLTPSPSSFFLNFPPLLCNHRIFVQFLSHQRIYSGNSGYHELLTEKTSCFRWPDRASDGQPLPPPSGLLDRPSPAPSTTSRDDLLDPDPKSSSGDVQQQLRTPRASFPPPASRRRRPQRAPALAPVALHTPPRLHPSRALVGSPLGASAPAETASRAGARRRRSLGGGWDKGVERRGGCEVCPD